MKYVVFSLSLFILISCASQATLYPSNDLAEESGVLTATYMNYGLGSGKISIEMPNGELLEGEYSTVDTSTYNFGNVYSTVFDSSGNSQGVSTVNTTSVTGSSPGVATLFGTNNTRMTCEYYVNNFTGKGSGACETSNGELFSLYF